MADLPQQGESLPDLELTTESGEHIGTGELTGLKTVLYFYPKDDTPGCTKEACAFRDRMNDYAKADIQVYGVSLDSPESRFRGSRGPRRPGQGQTRHLPARPGR
jgi:thioredoxin-dependent peroxiredoxin